MESTTLSEAMLEDALRVILPPMDPAAANAKLIRRQLAAHLNMSEKDIKTQFGSRLREMSVNLIHLCNGGDDAAGVEESEEEKDVEDDEEVFAPRRASASRHRGRNALVEETEESSADSEVDETKKEPDEDDGPAPKRRKQSTAKKPAANKAAKKQAAPSRKAKDSDALTALKDMARAAGLLNPALYGKLKAADPSDQEELIRERLEIEGIQWSGRYPKKSDIDKVKRRKEQERELDGIDTSLIISGGRSRRAAAQRPAYVAQESSDDEGDENGVDNQVDGHIDDEEEEKEESDAESSEASFQADGDSDDEE